MTASFAISITLVVVALFALLGIWHVRHHRLSLEDYLVSRGSMGSGMSTATVVASVAGAWILFSPAEAATWSGIAGVSGYALGQAAPLIALAVLGPRVRRLMPRGHSLTEFTWYRYGALTYGLTVVIIIFYMFVFLAAELTAISRALNLVAGSPLLWTALIVAAGTLAYTSYGGVRASIFTDGIQFALIVPLLLVTLLLVIGRLGGPAGAFGPVAREAPELLDAGNPAGLAFGATLVIAILAANLFHQGYWQRVYACRDDGVVRRSFVVSGIITLPVIAVAGVFGLMAVGHGIPAEKGSVALFVLATEVLPPWAILVLLILALALVMSSMDTLLNGIASVITVDLARFRPAMRVRGLLGSSRLLTVLTAIPAVWIAAQGLSVLYLFLIADLVCSAAMFPVFFGLYARRLSGRGAFLSAVLGMAVGALFFPGPDFQPWFAPEWLTVPQGYRFLLSFASAVGVSAVIAVLWDRLAAGREPARAYDFEQLGERVRLLGAE